MWWLDIVVVALFVLGVYAFLTITGFERRLLTRKSRRRAEDLYPAHGDVPKRRHWLHH